MQTSTSDAGRWARDPLFWFALAAAFALRAIGVAGDLPYVFHYDEPTLVDNAVWLIEHGTLDPRFFHYPTGMIYLLAALFRIAMQIGLATSGLPHWAGAVEWLSAGTYPQPPDGGVLYFYPTIGVPTLYLIGRWTSVLASVITVGLAYRLALCAGLGVATARVAALLLAFSSLALENAALVTTDSIATCLATACLIAIVRSEHGTAKPWVQAGLWGGLAAGVKYNAAMVLPVLLILAVRRWRTEGWTPWRYLYVAAGTSLLTFIATSPYALLDLPTFWRDLTYEFHRVRSVTETFAGAREVEDAPAWKLAGIFWNHLGIAGTIALAWGAHTVLRARTFGGTAVLAWACLAIVPQLGWWSLYSRYLLPPWPAVLILTAFGAVDLARRIGARAPRIPFVILVSVLGLAALAPSLVRDVRWLEKRGRPDPRIEMTRWIEANVPASERLAREPGGAFPSHLKYVTQVDLIGRHSPEEWVAEGVRWLATSGRENRVAGEAKYQPALENLEKIRASSEVVWSRERYTVYRLREIPEWYGEVTAALETDDAARARAILEPVAEAGHGTLFVWKSLALMREVERDLEGAMQAWLQAQRLAPEDMETLLGLGHVAVVQGNHPLAIQYFDQVAAKEPENALVLHNLAVSHLYLAQAAQRDGHSDAAHEQWKRAGEFAHRSLQNSPGDSQSAGIIEQVERMGRKWGFQP